MSERRREKNERQRTKNKRQKPFAKKSFGQNFLVDQNYIEKIISALNPQRGETIIEIGAGRGALTKRLVEKAGKVIAIELDKDLIPLLKDRFGTYDNFELVEADALKIDFQDLFTTHASPLTTRLVANLPFYISTAILQKLIEQREMFSEMILMFQKEVVERITAEAGNSERGFLTVLVEAYFETEKLFDVPPNAFRPAPKVWSSVARLISKDKNEIFIEDDGLFREIVSTGFRQKRKTIFNNLKNAPSVLQKRFEASGGLEKVLEIAGIEASRRGETLVLEEWKKLTKCLIKRKKD